jgi:hypothetical protein
MIPSNSLAASSARDAAIAVEANDETHTRVNVPE